MIFCNEIINLILASRSLVIYGAGIMGKALYHCLKSPVYGKKADAFLVKELEGNPSEIDGVPVIDMMNAERFRNQLILVALHEKYLKDAVTELERNGFTNLVSVTFDSDLWADLRGNWMIDEQIGFNAEVSPVFSENDLVSVYVVHNVIDKKLKENPPNKNFEKSILAGAYLTDDNQYLYRDDTGDNISRKNKEYCELTALYWIWKHDKSEFVGLSHYRRKFDISEYEMECLYQSNVDVIVTVPVINLLSVRTQYEKDHNIKDWDIMLAAVHELYPEYDAVAEQIQNGYFYFAYNMFIARKNIFNDYCEWLFHILDYCEAKIKISDNSYQRRYAGFLAERLMTIYFVHNKHLKIKVAKKHFIESAD